MTPDAPRCIFCQIARKELSAEVVYEDDAVMAFRDTHPKYPVHLLVIPKAHLSSAADLTPEHDALAGTLLRVGAQLAREHGVADAGFRLVTNTGPDSGQVVHHLHVHVLGGAPLHPL